MISVSYILLCGQILLLLTVILLQCLEGIHSYNSSVPSTSTATATAETPAATPGQAASASVFPFSEQPTDVGKTEPPDDWANHTLYEYRPPSPVVLCRYL